MDKKMGTICSFQNTRFWPTESTYMHKYRQVLGHLFSRVAYEAVKVAGKHKLRDKVKVMD